MKKCPECGEEIDHLTVSSHEIHFYTFQLIGREQEKYYEEQQGEPVTKGNDEFYCPECGKRLFLSEEDAVAFFKGEVVGREKKIITIEVEGGMVTEVHNLPEGYDYTIDNHDLEAWGKTISTKNSKNILN